MHYIISYEQCLNICLWF